MQAVAGRQGVGFDGELTKCVRKGVGQIGVGEGVGVAAAVEHVVVIVALTACDGNNGSVGVGFAAVDVVSGRVDGAARDENELGSLASVERKLSNAALVDDLLEAASLGLEDDAGGLDLNVLCGAAELEGGVDLDVGANLEDTLLGKSAETGGFHGEGVSPDGNVGKAEEARSVGDGRPRGSRIGIGYDDIGVGNSGSCGIGDGSLDTGGAGGLGRRTVGIQAQEQCCADGKT